MNFDVSLGFNDFRLHGSLCSGVFERTAFLLSGFLGREGLALLFGDLPIGDGFGEFGGENDVGNQGIFRVDVVDLEDAVDVFFGLDLEFTAFGVEVERFDVLGGVPEVGTDRGFEHFGDHVAHRAKVGDDLGSVPHRDMDDDADVHVDVEGV